MNLRQVPADKRPTGAPLSGARTIACVFSPARASERFGDLPIAGQSQPTHVPQRSLWPIWPSTASPPECDGPTRRELEPGFLGFA